MKNLPKYIGVSILAFSAALASATPASVTLTRLGSFESGVYDESATEIPAFDAASQRAFVTNAFDNSVDIIDLSDPSSPVKLGSFNFSNIGGQAYAPNSVAVANGIVAVALEADSVNATGIVAIYDAAAAISPNIAPIATADAGFLPDMLTFTPDGTMILVANEGEASDNLDGNGTPDFNPEGSITIIPVSSSGASAAVGTAKQLDFAVFEPGGSLALGATLAEIKQPADATGTPKVRIHPNAASVAQDLEPEYITVAPDGNSAYAVLQENNAIIAIDLQSETLTGILPLGYKDHSLPVNALDADRNDDAISIVPQPFYGLYMPDAITSYEVDGTIYIVTANEGDGRDPDDFGDFPGNGLGDEIDGRTIAFIGLERISGIMVYDITDPASPLFLDYVNDRDFSVDPEFSSDVGPEGFAYIPAADSPNGNPLLLVASEVSGSLSVYQIDTPPSDVAWNLTVLHHNDGESQLAEYSSSLSDYGNVARIKTAIDSHKSFFEGIDHGVVAVYAGDSFLAGPEFQASLDSDPQVYFDAIALSTIGYDAIAIGNHEFDFGPSALAAFIEDAQSVNDVPYLSANLNFSGEADLQALVTAGDIVKSTIVNVNTAAGPKAIGIIGATTQNLPFISSPGAVTASDVATAVNAEAAAIAGATDAIILVSHLQGISEDQALTASLSSEIDAIIAGGGDDLLGTTAILSPRSIYGSSAPANAADTGLIPGESFNASGLSYPVIANGIPIVTTGSNYG